MGAPKEEQAPTFPRPLGTCTLISRACRAQACTPVGQHATGLVGASWRGDGRGGGGRGGLITLNTRPIAAMWSTSFLNVSSEPAVSNSPALSVSSTCNNAQVRQLSNLSRVERVA